MYGKIKSGATIAKLIKLVYVYNDIKGNSNSFIGEFTTVNCSKHLKMGKDSLTKYINNGKLFKGIKLFSRIKLH